MKKGLYAAGAFALVSSFGLMGGHSFAAHPQAAMTVRLCTSTPYGVPALQGLSQGIRNGAHLATSQWQARFKSVGLNLQMPLDLDDAKSDGSTYGTDQERQNALTCIGNKSVLAYIGTLNSGAALVSEPILNRAFMTMISPANTNTSLTDPAQRAAQEPATYAHQIPWVTYYRTVTTDALQGPTGALFMKHSLNVKTFYLVDDKATYGAGLAAAFSKEAAKLGMTQVASGHIDPTDSSTLAQSGNAVADGIVSKNPDAVYCGCDSENAIAFVKYLRRQGYTKPVMGGDALVNSTWTKDLASAANDNYATSVGPGKTPAAFLAAYKKAFQGFTMQAYDATSYDAASIALQAIYNAKKAGKLVGNLKNMRKQVTGYVAETRYKGATGVTTFDRNGDTTNRIISIYAVKGGNWTFLLQKRVKGIKPTG